MIQLSTVDCKHFHSLRARVGAGKPDKIKTEEEGRSYAPKRDSYVRTTYKTEPEHSTMCASVVGTTIIVRSTYAPDVRSRYSS